VVENVPIESLDSDDDAKRSTTLTNVKRHDGRKRDEKRKEGDL
jgi:hypothetical protein